MQCIIWRCRETRKKVKKNSMSRKTYYAVKALVAFLQLHVSKVAQSQTQLKYKLYFLHYQMGSVKKNCQDKLNCQEKLKCSEKLECQDILECQEKS